MIVWEDLLYRFLSPDRLHFDFGSKRFRRVQLGEGTSGRGHVSHRTYSKQSVGVIL